MLNSQFLKLGNDSNASVCTRASGRLKSCLFSFLLAFVVSAPANAEDIEIYTDLTGDGVPKIQRFKPNILFALDTSGSMSLPEALLDGKPPYNRNEDYGPSGIGTDLYVYDNDRTFTNMVVKKTQNNCQEARTFFDSSPTIPEYFDQLAFWQYREADVDEQPDPDCPGLSEVNRTQSFPRSDYNNSKKSTAVIEVEEGRDLVIRTNPKLRGQRTVYYLNSAGNRVDLNGNGRDDFGDKIDVCEIRLHKNKNNKCKPGKIPTGKDIKSVQIIYYRTAGDNKGKKSSAVNMRVTLKAEVASCPDIVTVTRASAGDWVGDVDQPEFELVALECQTDDGKEGQEYPQREDGSNANLAQPNYTSGAEDSNVLPWGKDEFPEQYLFSENYHQYLKSDVRDTLEALGQTINELPSKVVTNHDRKYIGGQYRLEARAAINNPDVNQYCAALDTYQQNINSKNYTLVYPYNDKRRFDNADKYVKDGNGVLFRCIRRIETLKRATENVLTNLSNAKVGMIRFNSNDGGTVVNAVKDLSADGGVHRTEVINSVRKLPANGGTPIQEVLHLANLYYAGETVEYETAKKNYYTGSGTDAKGNVAYFPNPLTTNSSAVLTDSDAKKNGKFVSPIETSCQDNSIILFSDGLGNSARGNVSNGNTTTQAIRTLTSTTTAQCPDPVSDFSNGDQTSCMDDLAESMAKRKVNDKLEKNNNVYTYTVGYGAEISGSSELQIVSDAGLRKGASAGDQHEDANDVDSLTTAFNTIIRNLQTVSGDSFVSPAVAVNAFNRLQFREDLYFAVFQPNGSPRWQGNLKKYKLRAKDGQIIGQNDKPAIERGFFADNVRSFWLPAADKPDGSNVVLGGAARRLTAPPRTVYANLAGGGNTLVEKLSDRSNFISKVDAASVDIGAVGDDAAAIQANKEKIVDWTYGLDVDKELGGAATDPNFFLGENLHGTPFVIDFGVDENNKKDILFATTNQGLFHAINGETGQELWSYVADPSLFENLGAYYNDSQALNVPHSYGIDGEFLIDVRRDAANKITTANIFGGQRRGGSNYFSFDLKNANGADATKPPIAKRWTIGTNELPRLAQTWAKPVKAKVNYCPSVGDCEVTDVLFLAGGYDPSYDDYVDPNVDPDDLAPKPLTSLAGKVKGNAIYMVRESNGELLWVASSNEDQIKGSGGYGYTVESEMVHSFPTSPTVIDGDFDGLADFMFIVDIAGRVWRFDFRGSVATVDKVTTLDENDIHEGDNKDEVAAGIIAELSAAGDDRRFYNRLDVSLTPRTDTDLARFNIVTGSGYRAHPLLDETKANRLYFLFDRNIQLPKFEADNEGFPKSITYNYVNKDDNITSTDLPRKNRGVSLNTSDGGANRHGFYIELDSSSSEKMLNPTLTDDGIVVAVSYSPQKIVTLENSTVCERGLGSSSLYQINLTTGEAARKVLSRPGISAPPVVIEVEDPDSPEVDGSKATKKILIIGSESFDASEAPVISSDPDKSIDKLEDPGLNKGNIGAINKVNWWERRK